MIGVQKNKGEVGNFLEKYMQEHKDFFHQHLAPHQKTDNSEELYEYTKVQMGKRVARSRVPEEKNSIELSMVLTSQNEEMKIKIAQIRELINQEELKGKIFKQKSQQNKRVLRVLREKKDVFLREKMKTINESSIPNKSMELSTTANTNIIMQELFSKAELEGLWSTKLKQKQSAKKQAAVKSYTIDLSSFMTSARAKKDRCQENSKLPSRPPTQQKPKIREIDRLNQRKTFRYNQKNQIIQKQRQLNKNLSQLRNIKKNKINPQV